MYTPFEGMIQVSKAITYNPSNFNGKPFLLLHQSLGYHYYSYFALTASAFAFDPATPRAKVSAKFIT
jgi:hypothetical protein